MAQWGILQRLKNRTRYLDELITLRDLIAFPECTEHHDRVDGIHVRLEEFKRSRLTLSRQTHILNPRRFCQL